MKTPEENKCGMECIRSNASRVCIKTESGQCPRCEQLVEEGLVRIHKLESTYSQVSKALCGKKNATLNEVLTAVNQLKSRLAQVERERDAAVRDLEELTGRVSSFHLDCDYCKDKDKPVCRKCEWKWRGVCEENSHAPS